jgi:CcmD family protein
MKPILSSFLTLVLALVLHHELLAANGAQDFFQAIGKMYVVVAVILVIFIGLSLYLWRLDRRISQLEKKNKYE